MDTPASGQPSAPSLPPVVGRVRGGEDTFFALVGGRATFEHLVAVFYARVATDEVLRPMYPEQDLGPAAERLSLFLEQYWGGSTDYSDRRGHPRLRVRHAPFRIDLDARNRWVGHMMVAVDVLALPELEDAQLRDYLTRAADGMVNDFGPQHHAGLNLA